MLCLAAEKIDGKETNCNFDFFSLLVGALYICDVSY